MFLGWFLWHQPLASSQDVAIFKSTLLAEAMCELNRGEDGLSHARSWTYCLVNRALSIASQFSISLAALFLIRELFLWVFWGWVFFLILCCSWQAGSVVAGCLSVWPGIFGSVKEIILQVCFLQQAGTAGLLWLCIPRRKGVEIQGEK